MPSLPYVASSYIKRIRDSLSNGPGYASASLDMGASTSAFKVIARDAGSAGNSITVQVVIPPAGGPHALAVSVTGTAITISLATDGANALVTASNTAALICAAINASATVSALVEAALVGSGAGSLSAISGPTALAGGVSGAALNGNVNTRPMNFLAAQDMASVLDVLQDALDLPAALTATGGTSVSVQDTGAYVANTQIGNRVTFGAATTTVALRGVSAIVISNTANALFFAAGALPATPAAGDTYTITGALCEPIIAKLRDGRGPGDSPAGHWLSDSRLVTDALVRMARQLGGTVSDVTIFSGVTKAGSTTTRVVLDNLGTAMRPDMYKNLRLVISGQTRKIVGNDDVAVFFDLPLSGAPSASTSLTISKATDGTDASDNLKFAAGGQPGGNVRLADLIRVCEAAVVAFTLPT